MSKSLSTKAINFASRIAISSLFMGTTFVAPGFAMFSSFDELEWTSRSSPLKEWANVNNSLTECLSCNSFLDECTIINSPLIEWSSLSTPLNLTRSDEDENLVVSMNSEKQQDNILIKKQNPIEKKSDTSSILINYNVKSTDSRNKENIYQKQNRKPSQNQENNSISKKRKLRNNGAHNNMSLEPLSQPTHVLQASYTPLNNRLPLRPVDTNNPQWQQSQQKKKQQPQQLHWHQSHQFEKKERQQVQKKKSHLFQEKQQTYPSQKQKELQGKQQLEWECYQQWQHYQQQCQQWQSYQQQYLQWQLLRQTVSIVPVQQERPPIKLEFMKPLFPHLQLQPEFQKTPDLQEQFLQELPRYLEHQRKSQGHDTLV